LRLPPASRKLAPVNRSRRLRTCILLVATFSAGGAATAAPPPSWREPGWRAEAEARIEAHRKVQVRLTVLDAGGTACPDVAVELNMTAHAFGFGTAVNEIAYLQSAPDGPYRTRLRELFNTAVLGNRMKWNYWEQAGQERSETDEIVRRLAADGLRLRGHTMVWQCGNYEVVPKDIERLCAAPPTDDAKEHVRARVRDHILAIGSHFRGRLRDWDVLNETVEWTRISGFLEPETPNVGSPDLAAWLHLARAADPGARLYINDYHILVGEFTDHRRTYDAIAGRLLEHGAPLGGIGFQCHYYSGDLVPSPREVHARIDAFARHGLPLAVTEFDAYGAGWGADTAEAEENQARLLGDMLTLAFSHPAMEQFIMWDFWDSDHWGGCAPLFRADWSEKPGLAVWRSLVFDRWWTRRAGATTDEEGACTLRVFAGDYDVALTRAGATAHATIRVGRESTAHVLRLPE
jgi:GH35 family endo-1,4-beta-xylanase